jgi:hypothetical protein
MPDITRLSYGAGTSGFLGAGIVVSDESPERFFFFFRVFLLKAEYFPKMAAFQNAHNLINQTVCGNQSTAPTLLVVG